MGDGRAGMEALSLSLIDTLRAASKQKVDERLRPDTLKVQSVRSCLDRYEAARREDIEVVILNEALRALGQDPVSPTLSVDGELSRLRQSLSELFPYLFEAPTQPVPPLPEPEPLGVPNDLGFIEPPVVTKAPKPEPTDVEVERAHKLLAEVRDFVESNYSGEHPLRLRLLFQAWVAECRQLLDRFPEEHPLHRDLVEKVIRGVSDLKVKAKVEPFIKGLAFGSRENWYRIATDSRKKLRKFDADASQAPNPPKGPKSTPKQAKPEPEKTETSFTWPELPLLRKVMAATDYPLLIVGGSYQDQTKLAIIYARFGVRCEWCSFGHDNARAVDAIAARIVAGKITGAMLVEGFMSHKAYRRLMKASDQNKSVPIAMAGKGGTAAFGEALDELERQLAIDTYKIGTISPAGEKEGAA